MRAFVDVDARRAVSFALVLSLVAGFLWAASRAEGYVTPEPELHDAGVWVTRTSERRLGRTNTEIATVDTSLSVPSQDFDVHQAGANVLVRQFQPSSLLGVDPVLATTVPGPDVPADSQVAVRGGTGALLDPGSGRLFVTPADGLLAVDLSAEEGHTATFEGAGDMVVGVDGTVHLLEFSTGEVRSFDRTGAPVASVQVDAPDDGFTDASVTAVGSVPVVLDMETGTVHVVDKDPVVLDAVAGPVVLQQPGPAAGGVLVAADGIWLRVSLESGDVQTLLQEGTGPPAAPVHVAGCSYGAWGGNGTVARVCGEDVETRTFDAFAGGARLQWRVNRGRVVLNEQDTGDQLVYGDGDPVFVDEWGEALTDEPDETAESDDTVEEAVEQRDRNQNDPPEAHDDIAGTRGGRPVVVDPLRNDVDPDGDVLVISPLEAPSGAGTVSLVDDGQAVLVDPPADRSRPISFPYEITDGHGHSATAQITVQIVPDGQNRPPEALAGEKTTVVTGGTVQHNVVSGAFDPDGDPVTLVSATTDAGEVVFEPDGEIAFTATNAPGLVEVVYELADDRGGRGSGVLAVNVVPRERNEPPVARNDQAGTLVGREVVVDVLANDDDANGDEVSIVRVDNLSDAAVRWEPTSAEIRVTPSAPGSVNLIYRITDGQDVDEAVLRVDAAEPATQLPPVAVRDDVRLRPGGPVFVPVLDNDVDPDGDVLIVTGVNLPTPSPVDVEIVNRSMLRIEATKPLDEAVEFDYEITDGVHDATGRVVVAPIPALERNQPPIVGPDEFTVRAGAVATLPVLANDRDPDGDVLTLVEPEPVPDGRASRDGRLFLQGEELRYQAPASPKGSVILRSTVVDTAENVASGQLIVHVIDASGERNSPPVAPTLQGRVLAGGRVTVQVPLASMDPEGDVVTLHGVAEPPSLGAVVEVRRDQLVYEADALSAGTDQFTYRVRDQFGLESTGTVLIGIAGASTSNSPPVAVADEVNVQPGTRAIIPVLGNDHDPDGDPIAVSTESDDQPQPTTGAVDVVDGQLSFTAPDGAAVGTSTSFTYVVVDGRGGRDNGTVTVHFAEQVPNRPPVPLDDLIEPQAPGTLFTTAPLQANDLDPDGDPLTVESVSLPDIEPEPDGSVTFEMPDTPLQFTYVVSDGQATSRAAVVVPVAANQPPVTVPDEATVDMLGEVTVDVLANDSDPDGEDLVLLDVTGVRHGRARVDGSRVVFTASEEGYIGDAGFSYRVADASDESAALVSVGTVQVTIVGDVNVPPAFTELSLEVPQGTERVLDLSTGIVDPDSDQTHTFSDLQGNAPGVAASLDGNTLTVATTPEAEPGTVVPLTLQLDDGEASTEANVTVTVVSSDRPLATTVADTAETIQGEPVTIPVLDNDVNPFPDTPLTVIDVASPAGATVTTDGTNVTVAPDPDDRRVGEVTFTYTVEDATDDDSRHVDGSVTVTVVGRPDVPAAPTCIGGESGSVQIGWAAPSANGARITEYQVRISRFPRDGGPAVTEIRSYPGGSTVQTVEDLRNGLDHTFEVAAVNKAVNGEPEFSPPSPRCKPDQVPDRPEPPATEFGDQELHLTFQAPPVDGSPIDELQLTNTTTGETAKVGPRQTEYTWTGLENGTSYRFTLRAHNDRGWSDPSDPSTGDGIPAGVPQNTVAPTTEEGDRFVTVHWSRPEENGDPIKEYRITIIRDGTALPDKVLIRDGNQFSTQIDTDNGVEYQFRLEARNKAGWSDPSPASEPAVSAGKPFPISSVTATEGDTTSTLTFDEPEDNGAAITRYEVSVNGGGWSKLASDQVVRSLTNGTDYTFRVRAVNSEGAADPSPNSNTINPYGKPGTPSVSASRNERTVTWSWPAVSGNGRSIVRYEVKLDSGGWQDNGMSRTFKKTFAWGTSHTLHVRAVSDGEDASRRVGNAGSKSVTLPGPEISLRQGGAAPAGYWYDVTLRYFKAGSSVTLYCHDSVDSRFWTETVTVDSNGTYRDAELCYSNDGPDHWVTSNTGVESNHVSW